MLQFPVVQIFSVNIRLIGCLVAIILNLDLYSAYGNAPFKAFERNFFSFNLWKRAKEPLVSMVPAGDLISLEMTSNDVSHVRPLLKVFSSDGFVDSQSSSEELIQDTEESDTFASIFQQSAPYISMHRGSTMIIHLGCAVFRSKKTFDQVMDDISILHLLGVKIVLILGVRDRLDERLAQTGKLPIYHVGMRITDEQTLKLLKEESGLARFEVESALTKGFRGLATQSGINVVSGNLFYSAKPLGVRNGIDFQLTGEVRKVEVQNFKRRLDAGDVVLLSPLGYSASGEIYNVPSESLAAECAARLKASKLIYYTNGEGLIDTRNNKVIQSLRLSQAVSLLNLWGIRPTAYNYVEDDDYHFPTTPLSAISPPSATASPPSSSIENMTTSTNDSTKFDEEKSTLSASDSALGAFIRVIGRCVYALNGGVKRAHIISAASQGALLKELYTRDGAGMLISRDMYEDLRPANEGDVRSIMEILKPLEEEGILIARSREDLLRDLAHCFVMSRDGSILACGMLKAYSPTHGEVACLAVHPKFRKEGRGELLLAYLERRAVLMGLTHLFVLSTRTMQWFEERGFEPADPGVLPETRSYDKTRNSKVYLKALGSQRDVEAEELLWNIT
jgi:amino-acid N-acetyltransferase